MIDPPSEKSESARRDRAAASVLLALTLVVLGLGFVLLQSGSGSYAIAVVLLCIAVAMVTVVLLAVRSRTLKSRGRDIVTTTDYDEQRYKLFNDALGAVSIGMGMPTPPPLMVFDIAPPNAFNATVERQHVVAVTPSLLRAELAGPEVEAIMAVAAARHVFLLREDNSGRVPDDQKPLGLDDLEMGIKKSKVFRPSEIVAADSSYVLESLPEQTLAGRCTGHP